MTTLAYALGPIKNQHVQIDINVMTNKKNETSC